MAVRRRPKPNRTGWPRHRPLTAGTRAPRGGTAEALHGKVPATVRARPRPRARAHPALAGSRPASYPSPTDPALRANPFPEVTDLICRLPLPTLFYRLEALHLGDLLRIWVRTGTRFTPPPQAFQGPTAAHRTPREARCFTETCSLSPVEPIPGSERSLQRKENSSRGCRRRRLVRSRCRARPRGADLRVRVREY